MKSIGPSEAFQRVRREAGAQVDFVPVGVALNDYDAIAVAYDEAMGADIAECLVAFYLRAVPHFHELLRNAVLLDLACGGGAFLRRLCAGSIRPRELIGVDVSRGQIFQARRRARAEGLPISFLRRDVVHGRLPSGCSVVTMNLDAMNHLLWKDEWEGVLRNAYRSLRPGGVFLFDVNGPSRLQGEMMRPEIIVKERITYVQWPLSLRQREGVVVQEHVMRIFRRGGRGRVREYVARIRQTSPPVSALLRVVRRVGFRDVRILPMTSTARAKHIFLRGRLFLMAVA